MTTITVAGPFNKEEAQATARSLGAQFTAFGVHRKDEEGFTTDECDWFVERDDTIPADRLFGYEVGAFLAKQYK